METQWGQSRVHSSGAGSMLSTSCTCCCYVTARLMACTHCCPWQEIGADTILEDFDFPERESFISLYPQGYCNVDKQARRMCSATCYVAPGVCFGVTLQYLGQLCGPDTGVQWSYLVLSAGSRHVAAAGPPHLHPAAGPAAVQEADGADVGGAHDQVPCAGACNALNPEPMRQLASPPSAAQLASQ
jgi:hypothetical protein